MGKKIRENIRRRAKRSECNRAVARLYRLPLPEFVHRRFIVAILASWRCRSSRFASLSSPSFPSSPATQRRRLIERLCRDTEARRPVAVNTFPDKFEQIFDKTVASNNMAFDTFKLDRCWQLHNKKNILYLC